MITLVLVVGCFCALAFPAVLLLACCKIAAQADAIHAQHVEEEGDYIHASPLDAKRGGGA